MKRIKIYGTPTAQGYDIKSMRVVRDDSKITDESRNTVYSAMRQMKNPLAVWDEFNWNEALWQ